MRNPFRQAAPAASPDLSREVDGTTAPDDATSATRAGRRAGLRSSRRRRYALVAAAAALAVAGTGAVTFDHARKTVTVDVDGSVTTLSTTAGSVAGALGAAGVDVDAISDRDSVVPDPSSPLRDGTDVVLRSATKVTVEAEGETDDVWLTALDADEALDTLAARGGDVRLVASRSGERADLGLELDTDGPVRVVVDGDIRTVDDGSVGMDGVLAEAGVELGELDRVSVRESTSDEAAVVVDVRRVEVKREKSTAAIAFETVTKSDSSRYSDDPAVVKTEGVTGTRTTVADVTLVDGSEESRENVSEKVTKKPVDRVVVRGTKERPKDPKTLGRLMAAEHGWTGSQWTCLENLWNRESGWSTTADNPTSSAYGIPQALPGSKMATKGADWATNPETQIAWGLDYIAGSYGSPCGAWAHSQATSWY
ncbi:G5 domain-containing protein [Cellulosimicrobium terreum]|nr:G5 domain-containing protein [Cellulosimicrobium terreum]